MFPTSYVDGRPIGIIDALEQRMQHFDHFVLINQTDYVVAGDATIALVAADLVGGWLNIPTSAATDNHEAYLTSGESVKFEAGKPVYIGCRMKLTEANTDDANWIFGLTDQGGANTLQDNGAGPPASWSGAVFFKVDGTMTIQTEASLTGAQDTNTNVGTFVSGTEYELGILWDGTVLKFFLDGVLVETVSASANLATTELTPTFGLKNGGANVETLQFDWWILDYKQ
jgi:hypothetical protein